MAVFIYLHAFAELQSRSSEESVSAAGFAFLHGNVEKGPGR